VEISLDGGATWVRAGVLVLTNDGSEGWNRRSVMVRAIDDAAAEGERVVVISHSTASPNNVAFVRVPIPNVEFTVIDDDRPGLIVVPSGAETLVVENGAGDTYTIRLTTPPAAGETVTVLLTFDGMQLALSGPVGRFFAGTGTATLDLRRVQLGHAGHHHDHRSERRGPREPPVPDHHPHGQLRTVRPTAASPTIWELDVEIRDDDAAEVLIRQTDGSTIVAVGMPDTYTIELTRPADRRRAGADPDRRQDHRFRRR
jgi:hypothetical protein